MIVHMNNKKQQHTHERLSTESCIIIIAIKAKKQAAGRAQAV